jgi:hypothetical protein
VLRTEKLTLLDLRLLRWLFKHFESSLPIWPVHDRSASAGRPKRCKVEALSGCPTSSPEQG